MAIKAIIPCAGYGTRMGMAPHQSKEMLWDKEHSEYIIDYSLGLCWDLQIEPLVISRSEKTDLNTYLQYESIDTLIINDGIEWYDTILKILRSLG